MNSIELKQNFKERGIRHVKIGLFDIDGVLRGKYVSLEKFFSAIEHGMSFCDVVFGWDSGDTLYDNVKTTGWHTGYPDAPVCVQLDTFRVIPWEPDTAFFLVDFQGSEKSAAAISPRRVVERVAERARQMGFQAFSSAEYEYFFFRETSTSLREKHFQNLQPFSPGMFGYSVLRASTYADFLHQLIDSLNAFDVPIEGLHTETGPGVYETAIRFDTILRAADKAALFKTSMKEMAARAGLVASFMAKPYPNLPGCSGHVHQSLWSADSSKNLFYAEDRPDRITDLMRSYIAGQVSLMSEFAVLSCPTINSYKRLVPGTWAPVNASWGVENRTAAVRAIPTGPKSSRVEYRLAGADGNPYLSMAAALASGLYGIENNLTLPPAVAANAYEDSACPLPKTLAEATARLKESSIARRYLGGEFVEHFVATREWEVRKFGEAVTDWERERYLEII
ncbi:MAG TPA: glutamine synthetase family protein [Acidobacteriota bacterium]